MSINKIAAERNQRALMELVGQPGNDVCADCKSRNPRWASYSLGIFICMNCASIHRKMGTHISKVKSLTMDTWSKEQVEFMKATGNAKSNAHYNPDETKHPPPTNMIDQERDSDLEKFIRSKYQYKSFVTRSAQVAALLGPSRSASSRLSTAAPQRSATMPPPASSSSSISKPHVAPALTASSSLASTSSVASVASPAQSQFQPHSISNPAVSQMNNTPNMQLPQQSISTQQQQQQLQPPQQSSNPLWNDLAQLQAPSTNTSLPLQFASLPTTTQPMLGSAPNGGLSLPNPFTGLSASPNNPFPASLASQPTGMSMGMTGTGAGMGMFPPRSMSLNALSLGPMPSPGPGTFPSTPTTLLPHTPLGAPAPSPFVPSSAGFAPQQQPMQMSATGSSFLASQPQSSPMFQPQPQPSPLYPGQQQLGAGMGMGVGVGVGVGQPMTPQPQMGNPFALSLGATPQPQPQPQSAFSSPQVQGFGGSPSPAPFMQQHQQQQQQPQQHQMFGQQGMNMGMGMGTGMGTGMGAGMGMGMGMGMGGMQGVPMGSGMPSTGAGWGQQPGFPGQPQQQQQPWGGM